MSEEAKDGGTEQLKDNADVRLVASFRLPVSVKSLAAMVGGLTREYGKSLTMRQVGDLLIIEQPNNSITGAGMGDKQKGGEQ